jgi:hypothetical protein
MRAALDYPSRTAGMNGTEIIQLGRREFLAPSVLLTLGAVSLKSSDLPPKDAARGPDLSEELSPAELETANKSAMARDMDNFWHKGYS